MSAVERASRRRLVEQRPPARRLGGANGAERAAVAVGGAAGAYARVALERIAGQPGGGWPWGTFAANLTGAFLLGYLATRLLERLPPSTYRRPMLASGFCGALTTFSTLQLELLGMLRSGHRALAAAYGVTSVACGLAALLSAVWLVRRAQVAG
ncbi:MAG TPA: fluoride efflux transporter CrcB [Gaiellales bacterium]|nr:fluoride efflux transporter CrcB [Gaiellales bacterium]